MLASTVSAFVGWFRGWVVGFGGGGLSVCPPSLFRPLPRGWLAQAMLALRATLRNSQERAAADDANDDDDDDGDDANGSYCEICPPHPPSCFSWPYVFALLCGIVLPKAA